MSNYLLAIDQGTTSTRAMVFDRTGHPISCAQQELKQYFPHDGWVEHDPEEIWQAVLHTCRKALSDQSLSANYIAALGITNQRETTILWDKKTGNPIYNAIVWQDRRTAKMCERLCNQKIEGIIQKKTGLLLDAYFSATKIAWLLDNVLDARKKAEKGELAFGTIDCFLLWRLTKGKRHSTDATNAARTLLFNIQSQIWDEELLEFFNIPKEILPEVLDSSDDFGESADEYFGGSIPITAIAGDQQAALIGQACFKPGMIKSTYGTGCFLLLNTGENRIYSEHRLLTTIGYRLHGKTTYALEGSIFSAGSAVQWLRDGLKLITQAKETEVLATRVSNTGGVYLVPAFTGLGAPYWDPNARGAIFGLTRDSERAHIVRATLEAVCYQTKDLMCAMLDDGAIMSVLRVDGGMATNHWLMQFLSDILRCFVERPKVIETTSLGVAYLAGLYVGFYQSLDEISQLWQADANFKPQLDEKSSQTLYDGWLKAVTRVLDKDKGLERNIE